MGRRQAISRRRQGGWSFLDWLNLGVDAYGALNSKKAGDKAASQSEAATAAQSRALDTESGIALANEGRSEESFDNYMNYALPANQRALSLAMKPINPNTESAQAGADYAQADQTREQTLNRNLQRNGVDPSSGAAIEAQRVGLLDSTAGKAAAMTTARRGATDRMISRIGNTSGLFNPLIGASSGFSANAASGESSVASAQGGRATAANQIAGAAGNQYGSSLSDLVGDFSNWWKSRGTTPTTTSPG